MGTPSLKIDDIHEGEPVTCELVIEVRPEIELPEFEDIEVEKLRQVVTDEAVDSMIAQFREQLATLNPVDRAAEGSDVVSASFVTNVLNPNGGEPSAGEPQLVNIKLADPAVRPEVRDALLGKSKGDEAGAEFDIEHDYRDATLAGKRIRYDIKINDVNEKIMPEIGPEFFKKVMETDIDSEADFRKEMKDRILAYQENDETARVSEKATRAVVARSKLEVPDSMIERQADYIKEQEAANVKQRHDLSLEEYLVKIAVSPDQYEESIREQAYTSLRRMLILEEIGKKFGVEVEKEEVEAEISRLAVFHGLERAKLRAHYYKNKEEMSQLSSMLRHNKVKKLILEKIIIKDVDKLSDEEPADGEEHRSVGAAESAG